ncbi:MAG: hypothetical protein HYY23_12830 [Verrucomicrobia bacterium]|nr:hypothetical protein [Verrucomicrobiota bacterium]
MPTPTRLRAVAYGNDVFVAVGDGSTSWVIARGHDAGFCCGEEPTILLSNDGIYWASPGTLRGVRFADVTFAKGLFVGVEFGGTILTSLDGVTWTAPNVPPRSDRLLDWQRYVEYFADRFVLVEPQRVVTSADGSNWSSTDLGYPFSPNSVASGNGVLVVIGSIVFRAPPVDSRSDVVAWRSTNGVDWVRVELGPGYGGPIAFGGGKFVTAIGTQVFTSSDGAAWIPGPNMPVGVFSLTYLNGTFIGVGGGGAVITSTDGSDWSLRQEGKADGLSDVTFGKGRYVAVGSNGAIYTSDDSQSWSRRAGAFPTFMTGATFGDGKFVIAGWALILTSTNAVDWSVHPSPVPQPLKSITYGNGRFVAIARAGYILHSRDAVTWTQTNTSQAYPNDLASITYGNGMFEAVGNGFIATSINGDNWTRSPLPPELSADNGIIYANGKFIVFGRKDSEARWSVGTSLDGVSWDTNPIPSTNLVTGVAYGKGRFVITRYDNEISGLAIQTSTDAIHWQRAAIPVRGLLKAVTYANGAFVAVGLGGAVYSSEDGLTWTRRPSGTPEDLWVVTSGNNTFLAVGPRGLMLQSGEIPDTPQRPRFLAQEFRRLTDGTVRLRIESETTGTLLLETSEDLISWMTSRTVDAAPGVLEIVDPSAASAPRRFYRARLTPR